MSLYECFGLRPKCLRAICPSTCRMLRSHDAQCDLSSIENISNLHIVCLSDSSGNKYLHFSALAKDIEDPIKYIGVSQPIVYPIALGKPSIKKSAVFLTLFKRPLTPPLLFEHHVVIFLKLVKKALTPPPPFRLNICPILQDIMYLFHPQISPSMPQKSLFMQISCC